MTDTNRPLATTLTSDELKAVVDSAFAPDSRSGEARSLMIHPVKNARVLIVDAEPFIRRLIRKKLTNDGYICEEAASGEDALQYLSNNQADLVILDVMMPGVWGADLLPEIKAKYPDTAVVMATAVEDPQTIINCMKNGASDYIPKPFQLDEVALAVDNALMKQRLQTEIKNHTAVLESKVDD